LGGIFIGGLISVINKLIACFSVAVAENGSNEPMLL
jgi:hypothetical protein